MKKKMMCAAAMSDLTHIEKATWVLGAAGRGSGRHNTDQWELIANFQRGSKARLVAKASERLGGDFQVTCGNEGLGLADDLEDARTLVLAHFERLAIKEDEK